NGADIFALDDDSRAKFRGENIGFVFQFHHLLPEFSAMENVFIPAMISGKDDGIARKKAEELLGSVGLADRMHHRPGTLSGGEQQRVAIVRALMNNPKVLLADEPTGNLDENTADEVFELIQKLVKEKNLASLVVTHNMKFARKMDVVYELHEGRLNLYDGRAGTGKTDSGA
ncbi:MAG: ABC transporter ATP-binding protein, partial [Nitrospinota bacterium]